MLVNKKIWIRPDLQVFGNLAALTQDRPGRGVGTGQNEGPPGQGTGNQDTGQCQGKGCHTGDAQTTNLNGWS
jgi:hypothetical protein